MKRILVLLVITFSLFGFSQDIKLNGTVSVENNQIKNVLEPTDGNDVVTKDYLMTEINKLKQEIDSLKLKLNDSDGDGVTDDVDTCPDTPSGETVDDYGCSINNNIGILYGYENNEKSLYEVNTNDGSLTKVIELDHDVSWNLVYDGSNNQIISSSEQNSGGSVVSLIVVDLNSNSVTYPEFQYTYSGQRITSLVIGNK